MNRLDRLVRAGVLGCAIACGACGGDSSSALQGIYQASTWTSNELGCDAEGPSVLETQAETIFYVKEENFLGIEFLNVSFCSDLADCETMAADDDTIYVGRWGFEDGSDAGGWTTSWFEGFPDENDVCQGLFARAGMTGVEGESVRVEVRRSQTAPFPANEDGWCEDEDAEPAAEGMPCAELEVMTATWLAELP
jgi:hypothetical protein